MRWLTMRRRRGDRGAAAVLIAILVPIFLLLAGALVVDMGSWYSVRAQSQNGADASALAVAESCALGKCDVTLATQYSASNSNSNIGSGGASYRLVCGVAVGSTPSLTPCSDPSIPANNCPPAPYAGANYVNVQTWSNNKIGLNGGVPLPGMANLFGNARTQIAACAQAAWGPAGSCGNCVPLTISLCEWYLDTNNGNTFAKAPSSGATYGTNTSPYTSPPSYIDTISARRNSAAYNTDGSSTVDASNYYRSNNITDPHNPAMTSAIAGSETILLAHSAGTTGYGGSSCATGSDNSNQTAPGQFGWLCKGKSCACSISIVGGTYTGSTGSPPPNCESLFQNSRTNAQPIYIPVYSSVTGSGSGTTYTLAGFAAFVITGWGGLNSGGFTTTACDSIVTLSDTNGPDVALKWGNGLPSSTGCTGGQGKGKGSTDFADYCTNYIGANNCNGNATQAIYGYFTQALIPESALPGGGGQCGGPGQPKCLGASTFYLTG